MNHTAKRTLAQMELAPTADLYEHGDLRGRGSGEFGLTNPSRFRGVLCTKTEVDQLLQAGKIKRKWVDCDGFYVLAAYLKEHPQ